MDCWGLFPPDRLHQSKIVAKICSNFRLGSLGDEQADIQSDPQFAMGWHIQRRKLSS